MKTQRLLPFAVAIVMSGFVPAGFISAQDDQKDKPAPQESTTDEDKDAAKKLAEAEKEAEAKQSADIKAKLAVFKSLEGEWVGEETIDYNEEMRRPEAPKTVKWKDEWKGFFTNDSRYFEMTGKTSGSVNSTYHWYVTYDTENEEYRAWSFGSNGWGEYSGQLTDDGKAVHWEKSREGENMDMTDTFELRGKGDKCTAAGETKFTSKDGSISQVYAKQHSLYTRKKIEI